MCGIAGFCSFQKDFTRERKWQEQRVREMGKTICHRGPDDFQILLKEHIAFAHTRLAVIDPEHGRQPMTKKNENYTYSMVYNGEIYNTGELRQKLMDKGMKFHTATDTEVVLSAYIYYGREMVDQLNGIYSFVIWDERQQSIFFCRDRLGVKPLFYMLQGDTFYFASEMKAFFALEEITPAITATGLCELFAVGPARVPGCGVYEGVYEVLPGHCGCFSESGMQQWKYWEPKAVPIEESYDEAVEKIKNLLIDSIERQLVSDVPICTLLSGGLDSSVVSAVAAGYLAGKGKILDTYSFDYTDNDKNFTSSDFQPEQDRPYVEEMVRSINSHHTYLECEYSQLYDSLYEAVYAKDLPGMTDVDASLLFFAGKIKDKHTVCLSGECADEIFGGYPWFRHKDSFFVDRFPWSRDLEFRMAVLNPEVRELLPMEKYINAQYEKSLLGISLLPEEMVNRREIFQWNRDVMEPLLEQELQTQKGLSGNKTPEQVYVYGENKKKQMGKFEKEMAMIQRREREISALNLQWFMTTLLERKDRMTMAKGLEVRVPFADHRLVSYLYALPWSYKYEGKRVKALLKDAMAEYLPSAVLNRKKCPYPKTYDPKFEALLKRDLEKVLENKNAPILQLVNKNYLQNLMKTTSDYGKPWFGQLMATPQMYGYLLQMNAWLENYKVDVKL